VRPVRAYTENRFQVPERQVIDGLEPRPAWSAPA
jgi:hypothetical protein